MSAKPLILACSLLAVTHAHGEDELSCGVSLGSPLAADSPLRAVVLDDPDTIQLEAGQFEAQIGENPSASMSGGVLLRRDDKIAGADSAHYDPEQRALFLEGSVRYEDPGTQIVSRSAEFGYEIGRIRFEGAEFSMGSNDSRGAADSLEINQNGTLSLGGVQYTTCPPDSEDWLIEGKSITLDTNSGVGTAKGMKLRFKNVPILYLPHMSFPISDARKSGILTPEIGSSARSGNEIRVPYYWNIAPNYDATITPRLLTERGMQLATEFRYLTTRNDGRVAADYLPDDDVLNTSRYQLQYNHRTLFNNGWRNLIDFRQVSDSQYFEDLGGSLSASSITNLDRHVSFDYYSKHLSLFAQVQDFQTIAEEIPPGERPYQRLPQVLLNANWPLALLDLGLDVDVVNFDRDTGVTGWRFNAAPSIEMPLTRPGAFFIPAIKFDYTRYDLSNTDPGAATELTRSIPITSVDTGLVLERPTTNSNRIQTIEARLLYVNIPYRDQEEIPVFDTIIPDLNLVQLYRKNRFLGVDRIGDTEQVSIGVTGRVLDLDSGRELVTATIGQIRYFGGGDVTLPDVPPSSLEQSDYIAQIGFHLWKSANFALGNQWGTGDEGTTRFEARFQYRPASNKIINVAYRFRRDFVEQGDVSVIWPITSKWNFVGRYNYSFRDREALEQFYGFEYESCCWGLRLVTRRFISTRDGTQDSSIGLQFVLKGMTSVGTAADKMLERGILGYSADLR